MAGDERDVDIAGFADRLAIVQGLYDGEQAGVALHQPRQGVEEPRPGMAGKFGPGWLRRVRGGDGVVDIRGAGLSDFGERARGGRIEALENGVGIRRSPIAADKEAEAPVMAVEPFLGFGCVLWRRAIVHAVENIGGAGHATALRV